MWIIYSFVQKVYSEIQVDIQHKTVYFKENTASH